MKRIAVAFVAVLCASAAAQTYPRSEDRLPPQILVETQGQTGGIAPGVYVRPLGGVALEMIKNFEGWEPLVYDDAAKYCTIGFGHLIETAPCASIVPAPYPLGITLAVGEELLDADSAKARLAVQRLVTVPLNDDQFGALSSFVYNLGAKNFMTSRLRKRVNEGNFTLAAAEFSRWVNAGGQRLEGLVTRRACERALFLGLLKLNTDNQFDRSVCRGFGVATSAGPSIDINVGENETQ